MSYMVQSCFNEMIWDTKVNGERVEKGLDMQEKKFVFMFSLEIGRILI